MEEQTTSRTIDILETKIETLENHVAVLEDNLGDGFQFFICHSCGCGGVRNWYESKCDTILSCEGGCDRYTCEDCVDEDYPQFDGKIQDFYCNICRPMKKEEKTGTGESMHSQQ